MSGILHESGWVLVGNLCELIISFLLFSPLKSGSVEIGEKTVMSNGTTILNPV